VENPGQCTGVAIGVEGRGVDPPHYRKQCWVKYSSKVSKYKIHESILYLKYKYFCTNLLHFASSSATFSPQNLYSIVLPDKNTVLGFHKTLLWQQLAASL